MKPPSFRYFAPRSVDETLERLAEYGQDVKVLAGGQSLVPLLNFRLAEPGVLVDINRVAELGNLGPADGGLTIGAMVRQSALERSAEAQARLPILAEALRQVGHPAIRHRGTIGGSLAHADPAAELPAVMLALGASVVARRRDGQREIPIAQFFDGPLTTALAPDELLTEIRVPGVPAGTGSAFLELARRSGDFAICGVAACITLNDSGRVDRARIALCGAGPGPLRAEAAEQALLGEQPDAAAIEAAAQAVAAAVDPPADVHGSAAYRRKMATVMTRRAVALAAERATAGA